MATATTRQMAEVQCKAQALHSHWSVLTLNLPLLRSVCLQGTHTGSFKTHNSYHAFIKEKWPGHPNRTTTFANCCLQWRPQDTHRHEYTCNRKGRKVSLYHIASLSPLPWHFQVCLRKKLASANKKLKLNKTSIIIIDSIYILLKTDLLYAIKCFLQLRKTNWAKRKKTTTHIIYTNLPSYVLKKVKATV